MSSSSRVLIVLLAVFAFVGAGDASGRTKKSDKPNAVVLTDELKAPDTTVKAGAAASEYRIGAQDLLDISVFQIAELSRQVRVSANGEVSLPLIGTVQAAGRTVRELEQDIAAKLDATYLQNPQVSVFVSEFTSQRVTLEGAVKKPGIYPLSGRTTLLQAIAMAEGLDQLADQRGVVVFRTVDGKKMGAVFDVRAIRKGEIADPDIYGDDIVVVDQSGGKTALRRFIESVPVLNLFGVF